MGKNIKNYKNYTQKVFEYKNQPLDEQELMEMANVTDTVTGIKNVVLWLGPNPAGHWKRIKVSNIPNKFDGKDCFTITIPDFKIIGEVNTKLIDSGKIEQIKQFILLNMQPILDYSDYKMDTFKFLNQLKKV
jgi:hypothetical protein